MKPNLLLPMTAMLISGAALADSSQADFLAQYGLSGKSVEQMVNAIDGSPLSRPLPFNASITGTTLTLSDAKQSYTYPVGEKFYLSFAPYLSRMHPCDNHSLSGCRGELSDATFDVKIYNSKDVIIINKQMKSYHNGFVGVWLPRNMEGRIEVTYQGKHASAPISTYENSNTCLTTLPLV